MFDNNRTMQTFREFIVNHPEAPNRTQGQWAEFFGISRPHFIGILTGTAQPSKNLMMRIEDKTDGAVPVLSWFQKPEAGA